MSISFTPLKQLKLPIGFNSMANCLYLHDSYITTFDFAKLVVAWLYAIHLSFLEIQLSHDVL